MDPHDEQPVMMRRDWPATIATVVNILGLCFSVVAGLQSPGVQVQAAAGVLYFGLNFFVSIRAMYFAPKS